MIDTPERRKKASQAISTILSPAILIPSVRHSIQQGEKQAQQKIVELLLEHTSELLVNIRREIETVNVRVQTSNNNYPNNKFNIIHYYNNIYRIILLYYRYTLMINECEFVISVIKSIFP